MHWWLRVFLSFRGWSLWAVRLTRPLSILALQLQHCWGQHALCTIARSNRALQDGEAMSAMGTHLCG